MHVGTITPVTARATSGGRTRTLIFNERIAAASPNTRPTVNWRRGRDSNPRYGYPYAAFRVRCFQPLSHLSKRRNNLSFSHFQQRDEMHMLLKMLLNPLISRL